jgi:hypothetical protein
VSRRNSDRSKYFQYTGSDRIRSAALVRQGLDQKHGDTTLDFSLNWYEGADGLSEWDYTLQPFKGCHARGAAVSPEGHIGVQPFRNLNYAGLNCSDAQVKNSIEVLGVVSPLGSANLRTANTLDIATGRLRMNENLNI